jgi:peptide/nickel transport system permease protein
MYVSDIVSKKNGKSKPFLVDVLVRLVREKPLATVGAVIVLVLLFVAIFANFLAPFGENEFNLVMRMKPPGAGSVLGTDNLGRDLLSRIIYGARISMFVSLGVACISTVLCTIIGVLSGFFGGKVDIVIQRFVDAVMCFPPLIIIMTIISLIGTGLVQVIVVLGLLGGIGGRTRVVRSAVFTIKQNMYVDASKSIGQSNINIVIRHILPNIAAPIIILFTVEMGNAILAEATLSFLGFGVPPPAPSWGGMLSMGGRQYMLQAPWMALWPGVALALVVYGINMFGDGLRDILDPRLRGGIGSYKASKRTQKAKLKVNTSSD